MATLALYRGTPSTSNRTSAPLLAAALLTLASAPSTRVGLETSRHVRATARSRQQTQDRIISARLARSLSLAHDPINEATSRFDRLVRSGALSEHSAWVEVEAAVEGLSRLHEQLRAGAEARRCLEDQDGQIPLVGVHFARLSREHSHRGVEDPVKPVLGFSRLRYRIAGEATRGAARQVELVLEEIRLNHTAELEHDVLIFTLRSRAILVGLGPWLTPWTFVPEGNLIKSRAATTIWGMATAISLGTAFTAPRVVDLAMKDSRAAKRLRGVLLAAETPVAIAGALSHPTWTTVVFDSGITNWWQRQTSGVSFDWRKLVWFAGVVVGVQAVGLKRHGVSASRGAAEIAATLSAIALTGGSYGAMLPLTIATTVDVVVGDGRRSLTATLRARRQLFSQADQLRAAADAIDATLPDDPAAARASRTSRQVALQLESIAERRGRIGFVCSRVMHELTGEAIARSYVPRYNSPEDQRAIEESRAEGAPRPAAATEPIWAPDELRHAALSSRRIAQTLRSILERALNEAGIHGTGPVRILVDREDNRLRLRVGNRLTGATATSGSGEGGRELDRLVRRLPSGVQKRGRAPASQVDMPGNDVWWVVDVTLDDGGLLEP